MTKLLSQCLLSMGLVQVMSSVASEDMPLAYIVVAEAFDIPAEILLAVALTESGHSYQGKWLPWPWTLNIDGEGQFYDTHEQAKAALHQALAEQLAVDIGLMQVSWRWHQQRFNSVEQALIPMHNLKAGAAILREQFDNTQDWMQAVGRYHDPGQDTVSLAKALRYRERVRQHMLEIIE